MAKFMENAAEDCVRTTEAGVKRKVISYSDTSGGFGLDDEPCHCCCSRYRSSKEASEFSDLEEEIGDISASTYGLESCRERRRENMPLSDDVIAESFHLNYKVPPPFDSDGDSSAAGSLFNNEVVKLSASNSTTQEIENLAPIVVAVEDDDNDVDSSHRRRPKKAKIPPSNAELEDFFSVAENDLMRHFTHRYNFDFVKEEPFEGRYEWVPVPVSHDEHVI